MVTHDPLGRPAGRPDPAPRQGAARRRRRIQRRRGSGPRHEISSTYILRNARRNPVRSLLTIASTAISLFLMMILLSFFTINDEVAESLADLQPDRHDELARVRRHGARSRRVREIAAMDGVVAATPFSWYGGKYDEEVDAVRPVRRRPRHGLHDLRRVRRSRPTSSRRSSEDKAGCVIGRKLAEDAELKVGDPLPLKGDIYPFDLNLTVRGIYDGPPTATGGCACSTGTTWTRA